MKRILTHTLWRTGPSIFRNIFLLRYLSYHFLCYYFWDVLFVFYILFLFFLIFVFSCCLIWYVSFFVYVFKITHGYVEAIRHSAYRIWLIIRTAVLRLWDRGNVSVACLILVTGEKKLRLNLACLISLNSNKGARTLDTS